jgi:23S rRNA pseudouridine955/2504/2580 synthase
MIEIIIGDNEKEQRIDRFLLKLLRNDKRSNVYRYLRKKIIKVNGKKAQENYFLQADDHLQIYLPDAVFKTLTAVDQAQIIKDFDLDIVHEDDDILIVNKPVGLLTHPDSKEYKDTLSSYVNVYLGEYVSRTFKPASIQRLDKNTSGLVIFAKNYETLKRMNEMMRERKIEKYYLAVVHGKLTGKGEVKGYILKDAATNRSKLYTRSIEGGKPVHTRYKAIQSGDKYSLVELELLTGRSHQIRVSLQAIGNPVVGDVKYGGRRAKNASRYLLHAYKVCFDGKVYEKTSDEIKGFIEREMGNARVK